MLRRITLGLTLCGLMAPVLVAQNAPVNTRVYISLYNVKYGDIPEYTAFYEANTRPILESMVSDGTITGFGIHMHHTGGEYTIRQRLSGTDDTNFETAALVLNTRLMESNPSGFERQNGMIQAHADEVWTIGHRNVPENTGNVQYVYEAQFQVNRAELPRWSQIWEDDMYPVLERAIADDLLEGYVVLEHNTGGRFNWKILWLSETWDSMDDFEAAFFGAAPMDHPMWSMYTSHRDELWQTLPPAN
ncbi:MAG TPA: hypothetical protein DHW54_01820 [Gemmatimonadetes bacterium]|nr:hypothetical protein [Gemmatimonadota bacterium]